MRASEVWRDYRRGANAVEAALIDLQGQHGLTDLEMVTALEDYQRTLLGHMLKKQHARKQGRAS